MSLTIIFMIAAAASVVLGIAGGLIADHRKATTGVRIGITEQLMMLFGVVMFIGFMMGAIWSSENNSHQSCIDSGNVVINDGCWTPGSTPVYN